MEKTNDKQMIIRVSRELHKLIKIKAAETEKSMNLLIVEALKEKYNNYSHFIRVAIIKQIREEENGLLRKKN